MKKDITIRAALALSLALVLVLAGCGGNSDSSARIVVQGTAANTVARDIAGGGGTFSSGEVFVNSERITDLLEPSAESAGQGGTGDTLFEATVDNVPHTVTLRVDPRPGFVFDEWKLNKNKLRGLQWHEYLDLLLTEEDLDCGIFREIAGRLNQRELTELRRIYSRRAERKLAGGPQLGPQSRETAGEEAFLV